MSKIVDFINENQKYLIIILVIIMLILIASNIKVDNFAATLTDSEGIQNLSSMLSGNNLTLSKITLSDISPNTASLNINNTDIPLDGITQLGHNTVTNTSSLYDRVALLEKNSAILQLANHYLYSNTGTNASLYVCNGQYDSTKTIDVQCPNPIKLVSSSA